MRTIFLVGTLAVVLCGAPARGQDLAPLLGREILGPRQATVEVQAYTQARVPVIPPVRTAAEWQSHAEKLRARVLDEVVLRG